MRPIKKNTGLPPRQGLYDPANEHDACGVGFVVNIHGEKSHDIVRSGLEILVNLTHRGAVGWDPKLSDGAGILIQMPDRLLREEMAKQGVKLPPAGQYGVGMVFLPREPASRLACEYEIERAIKDEGQVLLGWRDVPVDNADLAEPAKNLEPVIRQVFIGRGSGVTVTDALERKLYIIRKSAGHAIQALRLAHGKEFYVPSMSARTMVYKGMLLANQVGEYYLDLKDARVESALAMVHQRFSTNTFPSWDLAHPFRLICHNGEINTVRGNVNWIRARQGAISSPVLDEDLGKIWPLIYPGQSDSASFDNALELLVMGGYSVAHAMMMMIPEAWENHALMDPARRAFYEYHAAMMEPWDGPASIAFTDGRQIGATLDRNGLRPSRYIVTDDGLVIMGSECGCLPVPEEKIVKKWRLQPGKMFLVDLEKGRIVDDAELKDALSGARPYAEWIERIRVKLDEVESEKTAPLKSAVPLLDRQQAFAYTQEEVKFLMAPMAQNGEEPVGSMGNDSPLAVLSGKDKTLFHYFKQLFAQVTNPPIDPIREELVTSLVSFIGPKPNLLGIDEMNPPLRLEVSQPVLDFYEMEKIRHIERYTGGKFRALELDITYPVAWGRDAVEARLASLCAQAEDAVRAGASIIVISDRLVDRERVAIPALLALSAIHQHLVGKGLRTSAGLVVETGAAREVHHFALLGGYGAEAVHPYLALETLLAMHPGDPAAGSKAIKNFVKAVGKGLKKVMSKMGISTYMSYTGSQQFEAVGLARSLVDKYFTGTASNIEGIDVFEVAEEAIRVHRAAFGERECSVQRRHQKLVEEGPSPGISDSMRRAMGRAAVKLAKVAGYKGAGTCEFLVAGKEFYFIEVNCRIQVEHPVTEAVTGLDLVALQMRIAAGEPLGITQADVDFEGHAIEFRINAEDATNDFRPSAGTVERYLAPGGPGVRMDSHIFTGYDVPPFYDSLLGKLIVWGPDRATAIARGRVALEELVIEGITTNVDIHQALLASETFLEGRMTTNLLDRVGSAAFLSAAARV